MVMPLERAYQIEVLAKSECMGCQNCAQLLIDHPEAIRLDCYLCGSGYEPNRPWKSLAFTFETEAR